MINPNAPDVISDQELDQTIQNFIAIARNAVTNGQSAQAVIILQGLEVVLQLNPERFSPDRISDLQQRIDAIKENIPVATFNAINQLLSSSESETESSSEEEPRKKNNNNSR